MLDVGKRGRYRESLRHPGRSILRQRAGVGRRSCFFHYWSFFSFCRPEEQQRDRDRGGAADEREGRDESPVAPAGVAGAVGLQGGFERCRLPLGARVARRGFAFGLLERFADQTHEGLPSSSRMARPMSLPERWSSPST